MTEQDKPKRSYFVPALLLIIVISLTGNIVLYTKTMLNNQDDWARRGHTIIHSGVQLQQHIDKVLSTIQSLETASDVPSRLEAKSSVSSAFDSLNAVETFFAEAETSNGAPLQAERRTASEFLVQAEQSLVDLGNHEGTLTAEEKAYLAMLKSTYTKLKEKADGFIYTDDATREEALTARADKRWVTMASELQTIMNEPEQMVFGGSK
ncbi:hypothetical protein FHS18_001036 [Paenibacillus phyllosphaerae]|uniref:Chemotaxis methyl-accepting receptor HlyB-like 4HB MCP domain-containing protein n=1 Tax=Paenibacillus phyllosphaerae TaxID=274593 RepID=A0A7W5AUX1_9BACL|nr:hypothetical protein [Paenibacillus phyllosphaerae]MBB3108984.1 hypothetical protein [Paenibacillus phyllosphaerae]